MRCACEVGSANAGASSCARRRTAHDALAAARAARRGSAEFSLLAIVMAVTHSRIINWCATDYTGAQNGFLMSQLPDVATRRHVGAESRPSMLCAVNCEPGHSMYPPDRLPKQPGR